MTYAAALEGEVRQETADILQLPEGAVRPEVPLVALGLDSLAAVELKGRVEERFGVSLSLAGLLAGATLADVVIEIQAGTPAPSLPRPAEDRGVSLSHGERALWFSERLCPGSYNLAGAARIAGGLDAAALRRAFQTLADRHAALRTTFEEREGEPRRRILERMKIDFRSGEAAAEDVLRPFDLQRDSLVRIRTRPLPGGGDLLLLVIHHLAADFWSLAILLRELGALYRQEAGGAPARLAPPRPLPARREDLGEAHWRYWREALAGAPAALELATDRPRPPVQTCAGASRRLDLGADVSRRLRAWASASGATLHTVLLAAFQGLLHRHSSQREILVGIPTAGRGATGLADAVGYFVNPVVVRADFAGEPTAVELVGRVRTAVLGALDHADFPFPLLAERLQPERDASRPPLFQAMLALQRAQRPEEAALAPFVLGEEGAALELGGLLLESVHLPERPVPLDLMLMMADADDGLRASLQFNTDLFDAVTAERMLGRFASLLAGMAASPERRVADLDLLDDAERGQLPVAGTSAWLLAPGGAGPREVPRGARAEPHPSPRLPSAAAAAEVLAGIWGEVLGLDRVGADDNFFALGGHSLLVARVQARVRELLGAELPLSAFFQAPTVAGLARLLAGTAASPFSPPVRLPRDGRDFPLSFAQERLWLLERLEPGAAVYHMAGGARLEGPLDLRALRRALAALAARHEILRTRFPAEGGRPVQRIGGGAPGLPVVCLAALPSGPRQREVERLQREEARRPFDLAGGLPWRTGLLRFGAESHALLLTLHHLAADEESLGILVEDLARSYEEQPAGEAAALDYADFAAWQRRSVGGEALEPRLAWWAEQLADLPVLELPADRPGAARDSRGGQSVRELPGPLARALAALGRRQGATLFMTLLAGFQAFLGRVAGGTAAGVPVGCPVSRRDHRGLEGVVGLFVNTLVLCGDLSGRPGLRELIGRARTATVEAHERDVPFELLVARLRPERVLGRNPLFDAAFALHQPPRPHRLRQVALEPLQVHTGTAKFDLTLFALEAGSGLILSLEYAASRFDAATAARLLGNLETLLTAAVAEPDRPIADLPLLSQAERCQLLLEWGSGNTQPAAAVPVHRRAAAWAARAPDLPAVVADGAAVTYGELCRRASLLANTLRRRGVGPERIVAIALETSIQSVTAALAVLMASGAYLPLDPAHPAERLAAVVTDSGALLLLTSGRTAAALPPVAAGILLVEEGEPAAPVRRSPGEEAPPEGLAYVIYTSGSAGAPKGVAVPHAGLSNLMDWHLRTWGMGPGDRASLVAGPGFDAAVWEVWPALAAGASLHVPGEAVRASPERLREWLAAWQITVSFLPTPLAEALLELGSPDGLALRALLTGGDRLLRRPRPGSGWPLVNHYGPTEVTVVSTWSPVEEEAPGAPLPSIGRPIHGIAVRVVDPAGELLPAGAAGELLLGGAGLARGYLGRPDLTAERFVPAPFSAVPGARLYRTGDRVRFRLDGRLDFLGRVDQQVKIRGFRIEPGEVEAVLAAHPGLREAVVTAHAYPDGMRLAAYVVPRDGEVPDADLRAWLRRKLAEAMVPSAFVSLPRLPLTANGKVDRRALPSPAPAPDKARTAPRNPLEEGVAAVWAEVLGVDAGKVGLEDDFFGAGGHSLMAPRLAARLREVCGVELPLRTVFEHPTVAGLAAAVEEARRGAPTRPLPPVERVPRQPAPPLTLAQERLWFLDQLEPGSPLYNLPVAVRLQGDLDPRALCRAFAGVVARHEPLRTTFRAVAGQPVQHVAPALLLTLPWIDLGGLAGDLAQAETFRLAEADARQPFDLERGLLLRTTLLRLAGDEHALLLNVHHIVTDGRSMNILLRELSALYGEETGRGVAALPELPVQFADYAVWQRRWLARAAPGELLDWWRRRLANAPAILELPLDRPRPPARTSRGGSCRLALDPQAARALRSLGRRHGASLFLTLLAVLAALLRRVTGQGDLVLGTPTANRLLPEVEPLIGFFVNNLVLRLDASGDPTFRDLLAGVREAGLAAYAHEIPFEYLVQELRPERDLSHNVLFQVVFALEGTDRPAMVLPGDVRLSPLPVRSATAKFDLAFHLEEGVGGVAGVLEYSRDLFDGPTATRLLTHFANLAREAADDPRRRLFDLPILDAAERHQALVEANDTRVEPPADPFVHRWIAARCAETPDAPAVRSEGRAALGYGELERRANQLAHRLIGLGVQPETQVAVALERSPELIVAMLGVWKAGGAFVPLDAACSRDRLEDMLADSQAVVLLTSARLADGLTETSTVPLILDEGWSSLAGEPELDPGVPLLAENLACVIHPPGSRGRPRGVMIRHASLASGAAAARLTRGAERVPRLLDTHGLIDSTILATVGDLTARPAGGRQEAPVGRALADTELYLLDEALQPVPLGTAGELFIGGGLLPRGYHGRQDLTAERFVPHGFSRVPGARLYRTGDRARTLPDGSLKLLGRGDRQVKLRGYRIELGEIEAALDRHADLDGVAVAAPEERPGQRRIVAYVVPGRRQPSPGELRTFLGETLPEYMLPGLFLFLDALPRTPNGTVDRAALPPAREVKAEEREGHVAPRDEAERAVAAIWKEVLGIEKVGIHDNFFDLGGHSLLLIRVSEALNARFGRAVPMLELFKHPTVDSLARLLSEAAASLPPESPPDQGAVGKRAARIRSGQGQERLLKARRQAGAADAALGAPPAGPPTVAASEPPGPGAMAAEVVQPLHQERGGEAPALVPAGRDQPLPLSFAQQRLWILDQLEPDSTAYHVPLALRLTGELDAAALHRGLGEILRRHEALRTRFAAGTGSACQIVAPYAPPPLPRVDLTALAPAAREAELLRRVAAEGLRRFDLARGPLFRATLLRLGAGDHALLTNMHHIVSDGWSVGVLLRELIVLYGALRGSGRTAAAADAAIAGRLPELPVQYADFAVWQRRWLAGETLERELAYWRAALAGAPVLDLPSDRPRHWARGGAVGWRAFALPAARVGELRQLGLGQGATLFMTLLAAWKVLLYRYGGRPDVTVGSPIANRTRQEIEGLVGFFVNTLVLRTAFPAEESVLQVLKRVRHSALGAFTHQDLPFEVLVEALRPERGPHRSPFFQAFFVLQNMPLPARGLPGLALSLLPSPQLGAKFDLSLSLQEAADGSIRGQLEYGRELFDAATAERLLAHFGQVLAAFAAAPRRPVRELQLLGAAERHLLLAEWNDTRRELPRRAVHELFTAQAAARPDAVALLSAAGDRVTYAELDRRAERLARRLRRRGLGVEALVGVFLERSPEAVTAFLAVLKAGGAYLPLDPDYPAERLRFMLREAGAPIVVTRAALAGRLTAAAAAGGGVGVAPPFAVVCIDGGEGDGASAAAAALGRPVRVEPGNLAYVLFTSGSTGGPKGVAVVHEGIVRLFHEGGYAPLGPHDVVLHACPVSFDVATFEIWGALLSGATLAVLPSGAPSLEGLAAAIARDGVTALWLTSGLFTLMVNHQIDALRPLRQILAGGDVVPLPQARRVLDELPECRLINGYGPTENTTFTTCHRLPLGGLDGRGSVPIGRPVGSTEVAILDGNLELVPVGVPGELYTGGAGLARGYLGRAELTAERFVPDGASGLAGARLYRSGDRARWLADGAVEFLGRLDYQVKVRGFRIELGEIETVLVRHPAVAECVVLAREDRAGDRRLVAYVVPAAGLAPAAGELPAFLRQTLPEYMIPWTFVTLDAMPLSANGKPDRAALAAPDEASLPRASFVAPRSRFEERIAAVWRQVLGVEQVGVHDNFFGLGGQSLLLLQAAARLREELGRPLSPIEIFEYPTVAALAERLAPGAGEAAGEGAGEVAPAGAAALSRDRGAARRQALGRRAAPAADARGEAP